MNDGILGVVALERIHARHHKAVTAVRNGDTLTPAAVGQLLQEMGRLIASHDEALKRIRSARLALRDDMD